jgi:hypothetical protein
MDGHSLIPLLLEPIRLRRQRHLSCRPGAHHSMRRDLRFRELVVAHSLGSIVAVEHPLKASHYARSWDPPDGTLRL